MQVGDRVKIKPTGERGWVIEYDAGWSFQWIVAKDGGETRQYNADELEPVNVTAYEGKVDATKNVYLDGKYIEDMFAPYHGKRVRVTIEEIEEG